MGVDVALFRVEQQGASARRRRLELLDVFLDQGEEFMRACAGTSLPLLARVKPYGSLVLASDEMEQLAEELICLAGSGGPSSLGELFDLAERCASDPATELHLDGD